VAVTVYVLTEILVWKGEAPLERGMAVVRGVNRGSTRLIVQSEGVETALLIFVEPVREIRLEVNEERRMEWQWTLGEVGEGVRRELQKLGWWSAWAEAFISSTRRATPVPLASCLSGSTRWLLPDTGRSSHRRGSSVIHN